MAEGGDGAYVYPEAAHCAAYFRDMTPVGHTPSRQQGLFVLLCFRLSLTEAVCV